jgi:hypothetical protein
MPTLRRESAGSLQPGTLLESENPYESRRLTVEYDGVTTAAYLHDATTTVAATWIANHVAAPASTDVARIESGQAPIMPSGHTKLPEGRPPIEPGTLEPLWFEEGDGVAVLENGKLLAVIPGWSDASRGMPGYSRDIVGQTPFGWSLDDAMEGLGPRVERARAYWKWRGHERSWGVFQQGVLGHLTERLGEGAHYWDASMGKQPLAGISERPPTPDRPYTVLSTVGMSCQRMPVVERLVQDPAQYARIELAMATTMAPALAARVFLWLASYPWRAVTWFGPGHSVRWYHEPATFPLGEGHEAVLLLDEPGGLAGPEAPDLSGYSFGGDPVRWLWVMPITEQERLVAKEQGSSQLITQLASEHRSWVVEDAGESE